VADRDEILASASLLFATQPAATMDEVAHATGVSRATLFRRFPSRTALVSELSRLAIDAYADVVEQSRPEAGDPLTALDRLVRALAGIGAQHGLLVLQPLPALVETSLLARAESADRRIRALVHRGQSAGMLRTDLSADWVLLAVTWLCVGVADGVRQGRLAPADVERLVATTVLDGLRQQP